MLRMLRNKKAQSILEYAVLLGLAGIALSSMQVYFKRGIQSVIKVAADEVGKQEDSEDFDPIKGTKADSIVRRQASGAPAGDAHLDPGAAERTIVNADGSRTKYTYSVSEVKPYCKDNDCSDTANSYSTYVSRN